MTDITPLVPKNRQIISSYGNGGFTISGQRYDSSVIVLQTQVVAWNIGDIAGLNEQDFSAIIQHKDEIELLLLGTGLKTVFPPEGISRYLKSEGIKLEIMDTGAACRTYNVLQSEERRAAVGLVRV